MHRRDFITLAGASLLPLPAWAAKEKILMRAIPSSGEKIPAVGLGTDSYLSADAQLRNAASQVTRTLLSGGGTLIDTASTYGDAETIFGDVMAAGNLRDKLFIATKLEAPDADELKRSLARLKTAKLDLLQLHNVRDPNQSLAQFHDWKAQGIIRYTGITATWHGNYAALEATLRREKPDFVQVGYSIEDRLAEEKILPLAAEVKAAVLTAVPLGRGGLFRAVRGKEIPGWAKGFASSWAQFFLKFLLADPRVTAVIPGTTDPAHMAENLGALHGPLPDPDQRQKMIAFVRSL